MVFFHGGSYGWGGISDPMYDGENFVKTHPDIVLVTVGYRTGIMGFIDFSSVPGGEEYAESGSIALTYSTEECSRLTEMLLEETGAESMADLTNHMRSIV